MCKTRQLDVVIHTGITNEGLQPSERAIRAIERQFPVNATKSIQSLQSVLIFHTELKVKELKSKTNFKRPKHF